MACGFKYNRLWHNKKHPQMWCVELCVLCGKLFEMKELKVTLVG